MNHLAICELLKYLKIQIKLHWWLKMFQKLYTIKMFPKSVSENIYNKNVPWEHFYCI